MSSYVYVKNPNGKTYVYENTTYWDKEAKKSRHKRKCIGHLDSETGEIVPNHTKKDRQKKQDKNIAYCSISSAGIEMLLNKASEDIKLASVLKEVFPDDWESILTCAYYIVSEGGTLSYTPVWQKTFSSPCRDLLSGEEISKLISRITPALQDKFFEKWAHMNIQEDYCIMSLTSFFSYDELTDNMHYGYNLDYRSFPQQNMLMFCGAQNKMPLYYKLISRETREVKTFQDKLKNLPLPEGKSVHFIMDKTYCSRSNIDAFSESDSKFIMIVPFTVNFARDIVDEFHDKIRKPDNYFRIADGHIYADTKPVIINGHKLYVHVYYNESKALSYERRFEYLLYSCKNEIVSGNLVKEHAAYYEQYFNIEESDDGLKVEYNKEAIEEKKHTPVGWFVLITNDITDKIRALRLYMAKDRTDKYFDDIMSKENMKGIHFYDFSTIEGRIFIQFIALIIRIHLQQVLSESDMRDEYDLDDVLREIKTIYTVNPENGRKKYITKPNQLQENIMKLYGLM